MKSFAICLMLLFSVSVNSQLLTKKQNRLESLDQTFFLKSDVNEKCRIFAEHKTEKNPFLAGTLSFIVPGAALGQFYKEEYLNGTIRLGISVLSATWFFIAPPLNFEKGGSSSQKVIAAIIFAGNWIVSVFDASSGGKSKNVTKRRYPYRNIVF